MYQKQQQQQQQQRVGPTNAKKVERERNVAQSKRRSFVTYLILAIFLLFFQELRIHRGKKERSSVPVKKK